MKRRDFVKIGVLSAPSLLLASPAQAEFQTQAETRARTIPAGADRLGETHSLGFSHITFKVSGTETAGNLFTMEHSNLTKGGPYRHVHPDQDEWLYALEGDFRVEIGDQKLTLKPGDSVLMPRKVPHVWAQVGDTPGKLLIAFTPAGRMEDFFRDFGKTGKLPTDPDLIKTYGLIRLGPPLTL